MGLEAECKALAFMMKTNKKLAVKKSPTKNVVPRKSSGRSRKFNVKIEPLLDETSNFISEYVQMSEATVMPVKSIRTNQNVKYKSSIYGIDPYSPLQNIVHRPPIAKSTSERLRSVLLSSDRSKFNQVAANNDNFYNFDQGTWKNIVTDSDQSNLIASDSTLAVSGNSYLFDLQSFPDIPQLADVVDMNANFDLEKSNSIHDQNNKNTRLFVDDSDTLSNQSAAENKTEQEQRDIDRRWAMSIHKENGIQSSPFMECEIFNPLDNGSLLGPQDTTLVQNDVIQNYIDKNDVQFMQLPESSSEVIETLQFYESNNVNESMPNEHTVQDKESNLAETNHTLAEFANMLPCPITGCVWHSHSATLYVHLYTCHQQMIYYGNSITHVFRCQDIRSFCLFTHLQLVQNTIYIITVAFDSYSHTYVATIQHVSSCGDNTSVSPTTAELITGFLHDKQHSWTGQVQPYSVPLNVLHADGRCLFIDPSDVEQRVIIHVNITNPILTCQ